MTPETDKLGHELLVVKFKPGFGAVLVTDRAGAEFELKSYPGEEQPHLILELRHGMVICKLERHTSIRLKLTQFATAEEMRFPTRNQVYKFDETHRNYDIEGIAKLYFFSETARHRDVERFESGFVINRNKI